MKLSIEQLIELSRNAIHAAREAAFIISGYAQKELVIEKKAGGGSLASQVVTEVDLLSQDKILSILQPTLQDYDLGMLAEESEDNHTRFNKDFFWCIDPLDGTLPFTERRVGYSVSIALISKEGIPQLGVVLDPLDQTLYHAIKGVGAFKNGKKILTSDFKKSGDTFTMVCDRSFFGHEFFESTKNHLKEQVTGLGYDKLNLIDGGGAVMNVMWVLENAPACYFKYPKRVGGGCIWDFAATACIFNELDLMVSDIYGRPLDLNRKISAAMNQNGINYGTDQNIGQSIITLYSKFKSK